MRSAELRKLLTAKPNTSAVEAKLLAIVGRLAKVDHTMITPESTWRQIGLDSLDLFDLYLTCEQEFGLEIADSQAMNFYCVGDLITYVRDKMEQG
jgi:acyl carrier protein